MTKPVPVNAEKQTSGGFLAHHFQDDSSKEYNFFLCFLFRTWQHQSSLAGFVLLTAAFCVWHNWCILGLWSVFRESLYFWWCLSFCFTLQWWLAISSANGFSCLYIWRYLTTHCYGPNEGICIHWVYTGLCWLTSIVYHSNSVKSLTMSCIKNLKSTSCRDILMVISFY